MLPVHLQITAPDSVDAGSPFALTVTALDSNNQTDTGFSDTVHFTTTDKAGGVPGNYSFAFNGTGTQTFTNLAELHTAGTQKITVTDTTTLATATTTVAVAPPAP